MPNAQPSPLAPTVAARMARSRPASPRLALRHLLAAGLALASAMHLARHARQRRAADRAALCAMSDRELTDLGIGRGEIDPWTRQNPTALRRDGAAAGRCPEGRRPPHRA